MVRPHRPAPGSMPRRPALLTDQFTRAKQSEGKPNDLYSVFPPPETRKNCSLQLSEDKLYTFIGKSIKILVKKKEDD